MPNADGKCTKPTTTPDLHRSDQPKPTADDLSLAGRKVDPEVKKTPPAAPPTAHEALDDLCGSRVTPEVRKSWRIFDPKPSIGTMIRRIIMGGLIALFAYLLVRWAQLEPEVDEFLKQILPWFRGTFVPWWNTTVWPWLKPVWDYFLG